MPRCQWFRGTMSHRAEALDRIRTGIHRKATMYPPTASIYVCCVGTTVDYLIIGCPHRRRDGAQEAGTDLTNRPNTFASTFVLYLYARPRRGGHNNLDEWLFRAKMGQPPLQLQTHRCDAIHPSHVNRSRLTRDCCLHAVVWHIKIPAWWRIHSSPSRADPV